MRKLRDIAYLDTNLEKCTVRFYGINFQEFVKVVPKRLNNILLLTDEYWRGEYNNHSSLYYLKNSQIEKFIEDCEYEVGDFCWVDFDAENSLDLLEPQEIAELLYLGHKQEPLNVLFFDKLKNSYAYCGHDDGWRTLLYCHNISDISEFIVNIIKLDLSNIKRRTIYPISETVKEELLNLSCGGLLIDFHNIAKDKGLISIPLYVIGNSLNMDDMYNEQDKYKYNAKYKGYLKQKNKVWVISDYGW